MALWTPASITTALWLDAADASTIALNGGNVSQWDDKSGNNHNFAQAVAASQPAYVENEVNGNAVLRFNSDLLTNATLGIASDAGFTLLVAAKWNAISSSQYPSVVSFKTTNAVNGWVLFASVTSGYQNYSFGSNATWGRYRFGAASSSNIAALLNVSYGGGGAATIGQYAARRNGAVQTINTASAYAAQANTHSIIGADLNGANFLNGDVYEIVLIPAQAPLEDQEKAEGYMAHRWAMAAGLVADHPYKDAAPTTGAFFGYFGIIRDKTGTPAQRTVRLIRDSDGACLAPVNSDPATGEYEIITADEAHTLIFGGEPDRNDQIFKEVLPAELPGDP